MQEVDRGLTHRWVWRSRTGVMSPTAVDRQVGGTGLVDGILRARGIGDPAEIATFLDPRLPHLHRPELLPGAARAAERILEAVRRRERIVVYGDYDVDGITAAAVLFHTLRAVDPACDLATHVPHRLTEGYGLSQDAIAALAREGAKVIISVDCGVTANAAAETAREAGVDLIITDHHNPPQDESMLPRAYAIVHPRISDAPGVEYPFDALCGAGVAFKLAWKLCTAFCGSDRITTSLRDVLLNMLPLVALGTIADVVPLKGENRVLTAIGLSMLRQSPLPGITALIQATGLHDKEIDSERVGFILAPHLNACGRMDHARDAVHLLTDATEHECRAIAGRLAQVNRERQRTQRAIQTDAARLAEDRGMTRDDRRMIVLSHPHWHRGVVGIVCSRLVEMFSRPAILLQECNGHCYGSARSIDGYPIAKALAFCDDLLETHGGHDMAAGLSLSTEHVTAFTERITDHANERIGVEQLTPCLTIDGEAALHDLTVESVHALSQLSPFGRGNPHPLVCLRNVRMSAPPRQIGSEGRHLSLRIDDGEDVSRRWLRAVWWDGAEYARSFAAGMRTDLVIQPKLNHWNGSCTVQGVIRDARPVT